MELIGEKKKQPTAFPQTTPTQSSYGRGAPGHQPAAAPPSPAPELGSPAAPSASKPITTADVLDKTSPRVGAVWRKTGEDVSAAASRGEYGRAAGLSIRGGASLVPAAIKDTAAEPIESAARGVGGFVGGLMGEAAETPKPTPAQASYSNEGRNYPTQASTAASPVRAAGAPTAETAMQLGAGRDVGSGVRRFDIPGQSPLFTNRTDAAGMADNQALMGRGAPTAANLAAMNALIERGASERAAQRAQQQFAAEAAQAQASTAAGLQVAQGIDAGLQADRQARTNAMDMRQKMGESTQDYEARTRAMLDAQRLAASQDSARADRGFSREKFEAAQRESETRFGFDRQRLEMARQRAADELATSEQNREGIGMKMSEARQRADLQSQLLAATDPKVRKQIAGQLAVLDGKYEGGMKPQVIRSSDTMEGNQVIRGGERLIGVDSDTGRVVDLTPKAPMAGAIQGGHVFIGGDPSVESNWKKI